MVNLTNYDYVSDIIRLFENMDMSQILSEDLKILICHRHCQEIGHYPTEVNRLVARVSEQF